ncbi:MAG: hypothetical protein V3U11_10650 [Planctomycetota bacterium]
MRRRKALLLLAVLAATLPAPQLWGQAGFAHNKLDFHNRFLSARELLFPNFLGTNGNVDGDGLFKVLPPELLERSGNHLMSGYHVGLAADSVYTGAFPVPIRTPALQLYYTREASLTGPSGKKYDLPDLQNKVGPRFDPLILRLPTPGAWIVEVDFDTKSANSKLKQLLTIPARVNGQTQGLAMMFLGFPGEKRTATLPFVVLRPSFGEKHFVPGARETYSGSFNQSTKALRVHGTTGQPSATGEVYGALRFQNPTLNLFGSAAGGGSGKEETRMGPGAYANDLGSRRVAGDFGLFIQAQQYHATNPTHTAVPLIVATSKAGPDQDLVLSATSQNAVLRVNLKELQLFDLFLGAGLFGKLQTYTAKGPAGFTHDQQGAWSSPRIKVRPDKALVGRYFWIQAAILDANMNVVDATNAVRMTVQ